MGLFAEIFIFSAPPVVVVELIGDDSLTAFVDVDVAHCLLARLV